MLFTGKEFQDGPVGDDVLRLYDFGARFYDPTVGRWTTIDPLAEMYYSQSPYNFCGNNPVMFVDRNGMNYEYIGGKYYKRGEDNQRIPVEWDEVYDWLQNGQHFESPSEKDRQKALDIAKDYARVDRRIMANSVIMEALLEISDPSELLSKVREKLQTTYGPFESKIMSIYSVAIDISKNIVKLGNLSRFTLMKIEAGLMVETLKDSAANYLRGLRIKKLHIETYIEYVNPSYIGPGFYRGAGGGGATTRF